MPSINIIPLTIGSGLILLLLTVSFSCSTSSPLESTSAKRVVRSYDGEVEDDFAKLCHYFCGYSHPVVGRSGKKRFVHGRSAIDQDFQSFDGTDDLFDDRFVHGKRFVHG